MIIKNIFLKIILQNNYYCAYTYNVRINIIKLNSIYLCIRIEELFIN